LLPKTPKPRAVIKIEIIYFINNDEQRTQCLTPVPRKKKGSREQNSRELRRAR